MVRRKKAARWRRGIRAEGEAEAEAEAEVPFVAEGRFDCTSGSMLCAGFLFVHVMCHQAVGSLMATPFCT